MKETMMTIDTTNMCSHLQRKLFEEDGIYHSLWIAMQDDPELTAVVRSRQLHIYRNGKKVLVLAGKSAPKIIREDSICKHLQLERIKWMEQRFNNALAAIKDGYADSLRLSKRMLPNSANTMIVSCGNRTLLLTKQGIFPLTSNAEYYQKMVFGICSLTIVKFKIKNNDGPIKLLTTTASTSVESSCATDDRIEAHMNVWRALDIR